MKKFLKKIGHGRLNAIAFGSSRKDISEIEIRKVLNASEFSEENAQKWALENLELIKKVCLPCFYNEFDELFLKN